MLSTPHPKQRSRRPGYPILHKVSTFRNTRITKLTTSPVSNSELGDAASRDGLSGVNLHTNGTEFYGNSSNLAFLGNLYARAHHQELRDQTRFDEIPRQIPASPNYPNPPSQPLSPGTRHTKGNRRSCKSQLSIVNLLYNADYIGHPSPQSHDGVDFATERSPPDSEGLRGRTPTMSNGRCPFCLSMSITAHMSF